MEKFSVVYVHAGTKGEINIFQADGSQQERVNVHHFYKKPPQKEYHNRPLALDTIQAYIDHITINWQWYLSQYRQNYI